ncbi:fumarylacetoacetate hydrolase family protein [Chloroflexota bacterium]
MKIVRFQSGKRAEYGILVGDVIDGIEGMPYRQFRYSNHHYNLGDVNILPPCTPSKIVALGLNYYSHAKEVNMPIPAEPLIFMKPSTSLIGTGDNIIYPDASHRVDYEGELGIVIRSRACRVPAEKALNYVLGYTCFNDVTARDLQGRDQQWTRAKGFDTFAAAGPCIETELDPGKAHLETYLNSELKQKVNTSDLIFPVERIISFISGVMTLLPGDIIATGTPSGIGPMQPGDTVAVKIAGIGTLTNGVIKM